MEELFMLLVEPGAIYYVIWVSVQPFDPLGVCHSNGSLPDSEATRSSLWRTKLPAAKSPRPPWPGSLSPSQRPGSWASLASLRTAHSYLSLYAQASPRANFESRIALDADTNPFC